VESLHGLVAQLALVLTVIGAAWAVGLVVARRTGGPMLYGELVWIVLAIAVAGLIGIVIALTAAPPRDPLHILYGLLAAAALPVAALVARDRPSRQRSAVLGIGLIVLAILMVRLFQTGG
jgi:hypothetical protein